MIKVAAAVHLISTVVLSTLMWAVGAPQQIANIWVGSGIIGANLAAIIWITDRLLNKKSIAMGATIIVIKYAALIGVLVVLAQSGWSMDIGFVLGLGAVFPTLGYFGYRFLKSNKNGSF